MASDLRSRIGKNSVTFKSPNKVGHIDLEGKEHFDKRTNIYIDTPHVQTRDLHAGPNGEVSAPAKTEITRSATKSDIRLAKRLAEQQGLFSRENVNLVFNDSGLGPRWY